LKPTTTPTKTQTQTPTKQQTQKEREDIDIAALAPGAIQLTDAWLDLGAWFRDAAKRERSPAICTSRWLRAAAAGVASAD
jgi:hypothetical protein